MSREKQTLAAVFAAGLVCFAGVSIALIPTGGNFGLLEIFAAGYLIGSVFGNAIAASAWAALGPGHFLIRLPLSILWILLTSLAVFCNVWISDIPLSDAMIVALCLAGMWLLVQIPYWLLLSFGNMSLRSARDHAKQERPQYGIGQLLIFTTIIAVLFGAGRAAAGFLPALGDLGGFSQIFPFLFLAIAAVLLSLPLPLAVLLPNRSLPSVLGVLALSAFAIVIEMPLLNQLSTGQGPQLMHFVWINLFTAGWIWAFSALVRWAGYRLAAG